MVQLQKSILERHVQEMFVLSTEHRSKMDALESTVDDLRAAVVRENNPRIDEGVWSHSILGEWSDPNDIAEGAAKGLHYVDERGTKLSSVRTSQQVEIGSRISRLTF